MLKNSTRVLSAFFRYYFKSFFIAAAIFCSYTTEMFAQTITQVFTTSGTFTVPPCITSIQVQSWGGGGAGAGSLSGFTNNAGGGGGGGGYTINPAVAVVSGSTYPVTVGLGGVISLKNNGGNGGSSSFNGMVVAAGGSGGTVWNNIGAGNGTGGAGGVGGTYNGGSGAGGDHPNFGGGGGGGAGSSGNGGNAGTPTNATPGTGGPGLQPGGGGGTGSSSAGAAGFTPGGGGSGSLTLNPLGTDQAGGPGANGQVIITYTLNPPVIISVTGAGCVGSTITINGTNLSGATAVTIGATAVTNLNISATVITGTIAAGTSTGIVSVTTPCGTATSSSSFVINAPPPPVVLSPQAICAGGNYNFGGHTYTTAGTYLDTTASTITGCDSITSLTITLTAPITQSISRSVCAGGSYNFGSHTYSAAGVYLDTATSVVTGCDSITTLTLAISPAIPVPIAQSICAGGTYTFGSHSYNTPGTYSDTTSSVVTGCDSITILTLSTASVLSQSISQSICPGGSYNFNGTNLIAPGVYADTLTGAGANGCDSLVVLTLTLNTPASFTFNDSICQGSSYNFNGTNYSAAGTYSDTLSGAAANGCDSLVTLNLSIKSGSASSVSVNSSLLTFCPGDSSQICASGGFVSYVWNNTDTGVCIYTTSAGNFYLTATDAQGCTAISNHLSIGAYPASPISISVNGDTLTCYTGISRQWFFNNQAIPGATTNIIIALQSGNYTVQITDSNGCHSTSSATFVSVGINNVQKSEDIRIYPNPLSSGNLQVDVSEKLIGSGYELFDANGRVVFKSAFRNLHSEITLDLAKGIYVMQIHSAEMNYAVKLVKLN